ncbi:MAG TPA: dihydrofolate reductase family protein [Coriobacteriia bacterium]
MRPLVLYITASLDGFIADEAGGVAWLTGDESTDYGYAEFLTGVDTIVMGSSTYRTSLELPGGTDAFGGRRVYVYTSGDDLPAYDGVTFVRQPAPPHVAELKEQPGKAIWLLGGGRFATNMLAAGLVDEVRLFVQPIVLGGGVPLWRRLETPVRLTLEDARAWPGGLAELRYRRA